MRVPREPIGAALGHDRRHATRKIAEGVVFGALAGWVGRSLRRARIVTADQVWGMHQTGHVDEEYLMRLVRNLPAGLSEVYCHPSEGVAATMARYQRGYDHRRELAALTSARVREAVGAAGVALVSYRDVV
jgi:hypothetical protein